MKRRAQVWTLLGAAVLSGAGLARSESRPSPRWIGSGPAAPEAVSLAESADGSRLYAVLARQPFHTALFVRHRGESRWRSLGFEGIFRIVAHPVRAETLYALDGAGVSYAGAEGTPYRSQDGGRTWRKIGAGIPDYSLRDLTVARTEPYSLYAVTEDRFGRDARLYRFDEEAKRWRQLTSFPTFAVALHPRDPDLLYVAADRRGRKMLRSSDGGESWRPAGTGLEEVDVRGVTFAGSAGETLYAWGHVFYPSTWLYRSTDGKSWSFVAAFEDRITRLAVHPERPEELLAGVFWSTSQTFRHSVDGGRIWEEVAGSIGKRQLVRDLLWSSSSPDTLLVAAYSGVFRGTSGLTDWTALDHGLDGSTIASLAVSPPLPGGGHRLYAIQRLVPFLFVLEPTTRRWERRALPRFKVEQVAVSPSDPDLVYAIDYGHLIFSQDAGRTWITVELPELAVDVALDPLNPKRVYLAAPDSGILISDDGGFTWTESDPGLPAGTKWVEVDPAHPNRIYAGDYRRTLRSRDRGGTWRRFGPAPVDNRFVSTHEVRVNPRRQRTMFVARNGRITALFRSRDRGKSWEDLSDRFPGRFRRADSIVFDPFDRDTVYLTGDRRIYRSEDEGESWQRVRGNRRVQIRMMEMASDGTLHIGTDGRGVRSLRVSEGTR